MLRRGSVYCENGFCFSFFSLHLRRNFHEGGFLFEGALILSEHRFCFLSEIVTLYKSLSTVYKRQLNDESR